MWCSAQEYASYAPYPPPALLLADSRPGLVLSGAGAGLTCNEQRGNAEEKYVPSPQTGMIQVLLHRWVARHRGTPRCASHHPPTTAQPPSQGQIPIRNMLAWELAISNCLRIRGEAVGRAKSPRLDIFTR